VAVAFIELFNRLRSRSHDDVVQCLPHDGDRRARLDFVRNLYEIRAMLDGLAARQAAERGAERARTEGQGGFMPSLMNCQVIP
jgi:hypothetical protein